MSGYRDIRVRVTPGAKREHVKEGKGDALLIAVREKAEAGKANARIRELIAKFFGVPVKSVRIMKGARQSGKMVRVWN